MGIVGTGDIGEHTARIARGFGMAVLAFDVRPREDLAGEIGFTYVDMNALFARSDVISLHVPGTEKTRNLISADAFAAMM
jgi:D-lactate dehydrogenase